MICVALSTVNDVALLGPNLTDVAPVKLVPVMVTEVPPVVGPVFGLTAVTVGAATITANENVLNEVWATGTVESVTVTVKVVAASRVVGVPVIWPVVVENVRPVGSVPPESAKLSGPAPPEAVTGVNGVAGEFCASVVDGTAWVVVRGALTVRLKVAVAVALLASVTVTVNVDAARMAVGVPVMAPVAGRDAQSRRQRRRNAVN